MPALISSPGVYTANESCVYEGSGRLKNSITTLGFAWPAFHNPLPRLVRRSRAETTLPLRRGWRKKKEKKKKKKKFRPGYILHSDTSETGWNRIISRPHSPREIIHHSSSSGVYSIAKRIPFFAIHVREKSATVEKRGLTVRLSSDQSVDKR